MSFKDSMKAFCKAYKNEWENPTYHPDPASTAWDIFLLAVIVICIIAILVM